MNTSKMNTIKMIMLLLSSMAMIACSSNVKRPTIDKSLNEKFDKITTLQTESDSDVADNNTTVEKEPAVTNNNKIEVLSNAGSFEVNLPHMRYNKFVVNHKDGNLAVAKEVEDIINANYDRLINLATVNEQISLLGELVKHVKGNISISIETSSNSLKIDTVATKESYVPSKKLHYYTVKINKGEWDVKVLAKNMGIPYSELLKHNPQLRLTMPKVGDKIKYYK